MSRFGGPVRDRDGFSIRVTVTDENKGECCTQMKPRVSVAEVMIRV